MKSMISVEKVNIFKVPYLYLDRENEIEKILFNPEEEDFKVLGDERFIFYVKNAT